MVFHNPKIMISIEMYIAIYIYIYSTTKVLQYIPLLLRVINNSVRMVKISIPR